MNSLAIMGLSCEKWINEYSPSCNEIFQINKGLSVGCVVLFKGDIGYEISEGDDTHTVCLSANSCTYRVWDLTRIPCQHAINALVHSKQDPHDHISRWYHRDSWEAAYLYKSMLVREKRFYKLQNYLPIAPPNVEKKKGIPQIKRMRGANELRLVISGKNVTRNGYHVTCSVL